MKIFVKYTDEDEDEVEIQLIAENDFEMDEIVNLVRNPILRDCAVTFPRTEMPNKVTIEVTKKKKS